jgi:hypothetical protein
MFQIYSVNENSLPKIILQNEDKSTTAKISLEKIDGS